MHRLAAMTLATVVAALPSFAAAAGSLCAPKEKVFFSCSTGKKIVSVCASADYPAPSASLQYRFGPGGKPEMVWPESGTSRTGVTFGNIAYSGGGLGYLSFAKGSADYIVYSGEGRGWAKDGVLVEQNGKRVAALRCKGPAVQDLWHTGLPEDSQDRENAVEDELP